MLDLYAVKLWHPSQPNHFEIIEVRTHSATRAEHLVRESFPGCKAEATSVLVDGTWYDVRLEQTRAA
jgi:hypothetical protein